MSAEQKDVFTKQDTAGGRGVPTAGGERTIEKKERFGKRQETKGEDPAEPNTA